MKVGKIRINTLVKFLNLCDLTLQEYRLPTVQEIMQQNSCSKSNAYNYLRALRCLFSEEALKLAGRRARRSKNSVQPTIQQTLVS